MSNQLALVADFRAKMVQRLQEQKNTLPPSTSSKITAKARQGFTLPDDTKLETLEVVILDWRYVNTLYGPYKPGQVESPICWSVGNDATNMIANEGSKTVQCDTCNDCPKNQFGSALVGSGKACKNGIRLAVIAPDSTQSSPVYTLALPPTSLKDFTKLVRNANGIQASIMQVSLDSKVDYVKFLFSPVGTISEDLVPHMEALMEKAVPILERGFDYDA